MNIVLADLPKKEQGYDLSYPSLAILYLIGYARQYFGGRHQFYYLEGYYTLNEQIEAVRRLKPDIYGTTITSPNSQLAYHTIRAVKNNFPDVKIICGGPHSTIASEHVFEHCPADICVCGEGEVTFVELVEYFERRGKPLSEINGIAYSDDGQNVKYTKKRALIHDLESIPIPAWDLVKDFNLYPGMHFKKSSPQSHVLLSRGCPFDCNFCSNPVWKYSKPWVRLRNPRKIAEEVERLYGLGIREIYLVADEFNVEADWAEDVCDHIASLGHKKDLFFHINIRADKMSPRLAQKLAGINVWLAHLGIESGNQRTLDGIGKKVTLEQIIGTCRMLQEVGIKIFGFFMLFHAWEDEDGRLCWEDKKDVNSTLSFVRKLIREGLINYFSWQVSTPWPGSRLWETVKRHEIVIDPTTFHGIRTMTMKLPDITERDVMRAVRQGVMIKTYLAVKSGNINLKEAWRRGSESLKNILGISTFGGTS